MIFRRPDPGDRFRRSVTPHLDAAYNLARWLLGDAHDAEDAVQDASVRAFKSISTLRETDGRTWFLAIVRNTCMNVIRSKTARNRREVWVEEEEIGERSESPEIALMRAYDAEAVRSAIELLSPPLREVIVLREFEEMSYLEIAAIIESPVGTVMSRLARARRRLLTLLDSEVLA